MSPVIEAGRGSLCIAFLSFSKSMVPNNNRCSSCFLALSAKQTEVWLGLLPHPQHGHRAMKSPSAQPMEFVDAKRRSKRALTEEIVDRRRQDSQRRREIV